MDEKTLKALHGSIAKWEAIVAGTGTDEGPDNCPLCLMFLDADCKGCPVAEKTGLEGCEGSPYDDWINTYNPMYELITANAELNFLRRLLPDDTAITK